MNVFLNEQFLLFLSFFQKQMLKILSAQLNKTFSIRNIHIYNNVFFLCFNMFKKRKKNPRYFI